MRLKKLCRAGKILLTTLVLFSTLGQLCNVYCGRDSVTETDVVESIVVDGRSAKKIFTFSDTSKTDKIIKAEMHVLHRDSVFHDFHLEDVTGKVYYLEGPADTAELEVHYILDKKYQQYWMRFSYTIDNAILVKNNTLVLELLNFLVFANLPHSEIMSTYPRKL